MKQTWYLQLIAFAFNNGDGDVNAPSKPITQACTIKTIKKPQHQKFSRGPHANTATYRFQETDEIQITTMNKQSSRTTIQNHWSLWETSHGFSAASPHTLPGLMMGLDFFRMLSKCSSVRGSLFLLDFNVENDCSYYRCSQTSWTLAFAKIRKFLYVS